MFMQNCNDVKKEYKHITPDYLESKGLLSRAKNSGYICPFCQNGTGADGTGAEFNRSNDGFKGYCHKCNNYFDIFDLVAMRHRLNVKTDFKEVLKLVEEMFDGGAPKVELAPTPKKVAINYSPLLNFAQNNLEEFISHQGGAWRGLTLETLQKFHCGFLKDWRAAASRSDINRADVSMDHTPRMIIPTSKFHYLARLTYSTDDERIKIKAHRGSKDIFGYGNALMVLKENPDTKIFCVEGEIDAMSIIQCGFTAIAFCGSDISKRMCEQVKSFPENTFFVVLFDNDKTGKEKSTIIRDKLSSFGFIAKCAHLNPAYSDANEFLRADEKGLKDNLSFILQDITIAKTSETSPAVQENKIILPEKYIFSLNEGIYEKYFDKKTGKVIDAKKILITSTPIKVTKIIQNADNNDCKIELSILDKTKNIWIKHVVDKKTIASTRDILELASFGVNITSKRGAGLSDFLLDFIHYKDNEKIIPHLLVHSKTGWLNDSCENFIYPISDEKKYSVQADNFNYQEAYAMRGDPKDWLELFEQTFNFSVGRFILGFSLAAPLVKVCRTRNFQVVLVAPSGAGKSALAKIAASVWGNPDKLHKTFNGTSKFLDEIASLFNDMLGWIDEFQSATKRLQEEIQNNIYNYAEGISRGRLNKNGSTKSQTNISGTRLYTSEQPMLKDNFMQGAFNRLLELNCDQIINLDFAKKIHKNIQKSFGHFGKSWIDYIIKNKSLIRDSYSDILNNFIPELDDDFLDAHKELLALSYCALEHFSLMLKNSNLLRADFPSVRDFPLDDKIFFSSALPSKNTINLAQRALDFISDLRFTHAKHFATEQPESTVRFHSADASPAIGVKFANGDYGFAPSQLNRLLIEGGFSSPKAVISALSARGAMIFNKPDFKFGKRINDSQKTFYMFLAKAFE